jgi:Rrf2 family protein
LIYLAHKNSSRPVLVREIAEAAEVPKQSLAKILHGLRNKGLVKSTKGPGGGYQLARPGWEMRVIDVIEAIDGPVDLSSNCILGLDRCSDQSPCALHDYWKMFREQYFSTISDMTLNEAALSLERKQLTRVAF